MGDTEAAAEVLSRMADAGADSDVTDYVQAEVDYSLKDYPAAERGFLAVMDTTEDVVLQRRCLRALGEVYRDCAALAVSGQSPIDAPATKAAELLSDGIVRYGLQYDSTLWEMLGMAYFEAFHTEENAPDSYLQSAADCFVRVIDMGVTRDYLYANLYSIYYEMNDYGSAEQILQDYEAMYPQDYLPHAFRGMMLITLENAKPQENRNYSAAV